MSVLRPTDSETRRQRIGALALVAVGLFFIWRSLADLPFGTVDNPGPGITPLALAVLLVACALWSMASSTASLVDEADAGNAEAPAADTGAVRHAVLVILGIMAAALAFDVIGYRLTVLGLLLFYLGAVERKPLIPTLLVSFGIAFGSHALFVHVLKVSLPSGPWGL
jgi:tripartite tricarboxylate transporter TctB family protein